MSEERITVYIEGVDQGASAAIQNVQANMNQATESAAMFNSQLTELSITIPGVGKGMETVGKNIERAFNPIRVMSRDVWSLAYAFRRLNYTLFGNNEAVGKLVDTLIILGSVLRIVWVIQSMAEMFNKLKGATVALDIINKIFNVTLAQQAFWMGVITGGAALLAGAIAFSAVSSMAPKGMLGGGKVEETGTYFLHKGETVSPENGPDYSSITINLSTGPINSQLDMEENMASLSRRIMMEKRRRGGS